MAGEGSVVACVDGRSPEDRGRCCLADVAAEYCNSIGARKPDGYRALLHSRCDLPADKSGGVAFALPGEDSR